MIGRIAGVILHRGPDHVLIDVHGVGYIVQVSERTAAGLPPAGQSVALFTDLLVREDMLQLLGFTSLIDKEWHRLLTSVQGVGARVSLAILGTLGGEALGRIIALGDQASLRRAPGVGPKLASRILMELKDKAPDLMALGSGPDPDSMAPATSQPAGPAPLADPAPAAPVQAGRAQAQGEALSALANLGYAPVEAATAVAEAANMDPQAETAALIRAALRLLAPKG